ncbi:hypothetical protein [Streptomyces caniscabiei]|uniref:hypothetical protein n=1 Tax=Streptomyces caniscabiei TaxID=2746961 RepID=UPI001F483F6D|nr:hypothetical protein [Streptomyces caniscabiei]MDX2952036.1 hypothetical protein [Streptomyces caniscabiei]
MLPTAHDRVHEDGRSAELALVREVGGRHPMTGDKENLLTVSADGDRCGRFADHGRAAERSCVAVLGEALPEPLAFGKARGGCRQGMG